MENKKVDVIEIIVNLFIIIIVNLGSLIITIPLGVFVLLVKFNKYMYIQIPKVWKEIKEL